MDAMYGDWGFGMGFGMWIFWIIVIAMIVALVRIAFGTESNKKPSNPHDDALEILKQRYARGEIDKDEYEYMKKELDK